MAVELLPKTSPSSATAVCKNCLTSTTPLWRRDEGGAMLCNACGLFLKLHGRPRPISYKTDTIKSRNRKINTPIDRVQDTIIEPMNNKRIKSKKRLMPRPVLKPRLLNSSREETTKIPAADDLSTVPDRLKLPHLSSLLPPKPSPAVGLPPATHLSTPIAQTLHKQEEVITLKARISELELVNDLYKRYIFELNEKCSTLEQQLNKTRNG